MDRREFLKRAAIIPIAAKIAIEAKAEERVVVSDNDDENEEETSSEETWSETTFSSSTWCTSVASGSG